MPSSNGSWKKLYLFYTKQNYLMHLLYYILNKKGNNVNDPMKAYRTLWIISEVFFLLASKLHQLWLMVFVWHFCASHMIQIFSILCEWLEKKLLSKNERLFEWYRYYTHHTHTHVYHEFIFASFSSSS